jgi:hypothetical protein
MADPNQIEQELREYLTKDNNLRHEDKLSYLMAIMNKHFAIDEIPHVVNHRDLMDVISAAKSSFATSDMSRNISNKKVDGYDFPHVLMIESILGYLNKHKLLKRLVKFDYTR